MFSNLFSLFNFRDAGSYLPDLQSQIDVEGVSDIVELPGYVPDTALRSLAHRAGVVVVPSLYEPFGIVALEAMSYETPVILSRQSGASEVLRHALKVDFWDVDDIANKVLALLRYPALVEQLTVEGRDEIRGMRWEHPAAVLRGVYREVTA